MRQCCRCRHYGNRCSHWRPDDRCHWRCRWRCRSVAVAVPVDAPDVAVAVAVGWRNRRCRGHWRCRSRSRSYRYHSVAVAGAGIAAAVGVPVEAPDVAVAVTVAVAVDQQEAGRLQTEALKAEGLGRSYGRFGHRQGETRKRNQPSLLHNILSPCMERTIASSGRRTAPNSPWPGKPACWPSLPKRRFDKASLARPCLGRGSCRPWPAPSPRDQANPDLTGCRCR